jgi:O-antigen ligase
MSDTGQLLLARHQFGGFVNKGGIRLSKIEIFIVCMAVFFAPYVNLRFSNLLFTYSDFFFCISLVILLISGRIQRRPLGEATPIWLFAFTLLFVGLSIGSLYHNDPYRGLITIAQYLYSYLFLMVILIRRDPRESYLLAAVFLASIILVDIYGIYRLFYVGYLPGEGRGAVTGAGRLATTLGNPNLAASINALTMPILLYFWSSGRLKFYFAVPLISIILFTVVSTSSNSGLFIMMVSLSVFSASVLTIRQMMCLTLGLSLLFAGFFTFGGANLLPETFQKRVLVSYTSGDISEAGTYISRMKLIEEAIDTIEDERIVVVGIGADQFRERSVLNAPVHNLYLLLWVEGGLLAVVGWILFSGVGVLLWISIRKAGGSQSTLAVIASTVAVFLTIALFVPHMYARYWTLPVFLCFGPGLAQLKRAKVSTRLLATN